MKAKPCLFLLIFMLIGTECLFAQSGYIKPKKNLIAGGINISIFSVGTIFPGLSLEYERLLNDYFTIGLDIGTNGVIFPYIEIKGRWYPLSEILFFGLGAGTVGVWGGPRLDSDDDDGWFKFHPIICPEFGFKIDIGKRNRWVLIPSISARIPFLHPLTSEFFLDFCIKAGYKF